MRAFPPKLALGIVILGGVALWSCEGKNPVGSGLVNRSDLGEVKRLGPISPVGKVSRFQGLTTTSNGVASSLMSGSLNRIEVTALLRFEIPLDSLSQAAGGQDITISRAVVRLVRRPGQSLGSAGYTVREVVSGWDESSAFIDTTQGVEVPARLEPIDSVLVSQEADTTLIRLPVSFVARRVRLTAGAAGERDTVDIAVQPAPGAKFMTSWVSGNVLAEEEPYRPTIEMTVQPRDGSPRAFSHLVNSDTFYGVREGAGPDSTSLTVGAGLEYRTFLTFALPDSLPALATINSGILEVEVAQPGSFPIDLFLSADRIGINSATGDTTLSGSVIAQVRPGDTAISLQIGPGIVQPWTSRLVDNDGMVLRSSGGLGQLTWVVLRNPRLTILYSVPPGPE